MLTSVDSPAYPSADGVGLCRRLRDDATTAGIPVVMMSAASPPDSPEHLWDAFLLKPTPIARLLKMIRTLLEKPRRDPERLHALE